MNQQQPQSRRDEFRASVGWIVFVAHALAVSVEVFLHRSHTFGERYLGLQSAAAVPVIFFYPLFWRGYDATPVMAFLVAYLAMCCVVRLAVAVQTRRGGSPPHTRYTGTPRVMRLLGRMSEQKVKCGVEPMLVFLIGALTMPLSQPLGGYLMVASAGLLISTNLTVGYERTRALDMHDAFIDQKSIAERFRDMRGD